MDDRYLGHQLDLIWSVETTVRNYREFSTKLSDHNRRDADAQDATFYFQKWTETDESSADSKTASDRGMIKVCKTGFGFSIGLFYVQLEAIKVGSSLERRPEADTLSIIV